MTERPITQTIAPCLALALAAVTLGCAPATDSTESKAASRYSWRDPQPEATPANQPTGAALLARAAEDRVRAEGRGADQQANPDYVARTTPWLLDYVASAGADTKILHDPYRIDWAASRGRERDVEFLNRYGARMKAKLWGPAALGAEPFPTLIFIPGAAPPEADSTYNGFVDYEAQLQQLAEAGYVVFAVSPQGQGGSEYFTPPHSMCDPAGNWKRPQELGLVEPGECAGQNGPTPEFGGEYGALYQTVAGVPALGEPAATVAQARLDEEASNQFFIDAHDVNRTRFVFAALDGADWLLSDANPWRAWVDEGHLGILGHSMGADAALVAGNGDPKRRFKAAVAWDGYGLPPDTVEPRVPTLFHKGEDQNVLGPYAAPPANRFAPAYRNYRRFVAEDGDAMLVSLRGSTHSEWYYTPYALINPVAPLFNASSKGGQVSHYYTLAWFDRWLKGGSLKDDARRRLLAREFDGSADATSIGSGTWDPVTQQNVPYRIAGENVADHLSVFFLSQAHFDGVACDDFQAGCTP